MTALEFLGISGNVTLAFCSLPQVYESIRLGRTGMNGWMAFLWGFGALQMFIFTFITTGSFLVYANFMASIVFSSVILYFKIKPRV